MHKTQKKRDWNREFRPGLAVLGETVSDIPVMGRERVRREKLHVFLFFKQEDSSRYLKYISFSPSSAGWTTVPGLLSHSLR